MSAIFVRCKGGCGTELEGASNKAVEDAISAAGWTFLSIARGYRCGTCDRALARAATLEGTTTPNTTFVDKLDPKSIGALPKATASTILAVSVMG